MNRHRGLRGLVAGLLIVLAASAAQANPSLLLDAASGRVLAHEEAFRRWHPASLTKLMTAYVAFRAVEAGEMTMTSGIRVSKNTAREPPSKMGYAPGSVMTLDAALKMIMVKSANDIAAAIGENIGKGTANFVARMNGEAARLGMTGTRFVNANGLHDEGQYTTARDLAILTAALRNEFPEYAPYFAIEAIAAGDNEMTTFNLLIGRFPGADGMKTGFVCASGFNFIGSATREGRTLVAIVLGARSQVERAVKAADMLDRGFRESQGAGTVLRQLQPYGERQDVATDMRPEICTNAAQSERYDERDEEGKLILGSPLLPQMDRPPMAVAVGLGGASDAGWFAPEYADVPVPTPRPPYPASAAAATLGEGEASR